MVMRGETLATGLSPVCDSCDEEPKLQVCRSGAGYYIGTMCQCGPYSRESGYYTTREEAQGHLDNGMYSARA